jgi:predicted RNase H-like HicB family nuclease
MSKFAKTLNRVLRGNSDLQGKAWPKSSWLVVWPENLKERKMAIEIRYELIVYWSDEDEAFLVQVPELLGCAADGSSYQEAVANAEVVIREWIETARELGRPIPEPRGRLIFA